MRIDHPARAAGKKLVVIVGGGFAGLNVAKALANVPGVHVVLVDQRNHHLFQPLLYQVATAGLNPADIAVPIRHQFTHASNVEVHLGQVESINLRDQVVSGARYQLAYDYLVLAHGVHHNYFGHPEWEQFAPGLKTLEQATEIRRRILTAFERAENELDVTRQQQLLTFVIVGGGPTGVELAGAIADISRTVLARDFRRIDPTRARIVLLEAGPRVLSSFPPALSERAARDLGELGVEVRTGCRVDDIDADGITVGSQRLSASSVFWAAGVRANFLALDPPVATDRAGRLTVCKDFSLPDHPRVFAVGDVAAFQVAPGACLAGVAPAAIQGGRHVAQMIRNDLAMAPRRPFVYKDKGSMATIGRNRAVGDLGYLHLAGRVAWIAWLFVHVLQLVGFRNRASVITQWAWNYLFSRRESRLITEPRWQLGEER